VLFAHGSIDPRWRAPFEKLLADLQASRGEDAVRLAYMEFARPSLEDVAAEAARDGVSRLRVLPLFMAAGAHVAADIPVQARLARMHGLDVEVLPPVGEHPRFAALLRELARDAMPR
jgi:sirohydrochlorin cobaltochelatase